MCQIWKRNEQEMNIDEINQVFKQLKKFGIYAVFVQGGEPLVRKDFFEIVSLLNDMDFKLGIISNGILLDDTVLKKLNDLNKRDNITVCVSLDSLDKETYHKIRGVDRLDKVLDNIKNLARYKDLHGKINTTITNINYGETERIHDFVSGLGLEHFISTYNNTLNYAAETNEDLDFKKSKDAVNDIITEIKKVRAKLPFFTRLIVNENIRHLEGKKIGSCDAFKHSFRLTSEGKLSPCLEMPPILDLKTNDINSHWKKISGDMKDKIRQCYISTPCFYGCTRGIGSVKKSILKGKF